MTGMLLSGADPLYAAIYQFVVIAMILASSGLTSLLSTTDDPRVRVLAGRAVGAEGERVEGCRPAGTGGLIVVPRILLG